MKNIPVLEHDCGDFAIKYAGGEYNPHEGEKVWFIPYLSTPDMMQLLSLSEANEDNTFASLQDSVAPILAKVIDHWTWTDVRSDEPLGKEHNNFYKPSAKDIAGLSPQEIMYLTNSFFEATRAKDEENPQPASSEVS